MAVVDAKYRFLAVDIGGYGSSSDGGIWKSSAIGRRFASGSIDLPDVSALPGSDIRVPHVLVGDEAFQLQQYFMRPYPSSALDRDRRIFNYRLSRARYG